MSKYFPVASVTVANEVGYGDKKKAIFFNCTFTGEKRIEALENYLVKGCKVIVSGAMIIENWKDDQEEYHTRPYIKVEDIENARIKEEKEEPKKEKKSTKYSKYTKSKK